MNGIIYKRDSPLDLDEVIDLYVQSTLGERRPVEHREIMTKMLANASLLITAWAGAQLIGIARTLTDFSYVAYLADLAVHRDFQKQGIGKGLIEQTRQALEPSCFLTLIAAPAAQNYYPKLGFVPCDRAWTYPAASPWSASPPTAK